MEIDLIKVRIEFLAGNRYLLLVVDKASRVYSPSPDPSRGEVNLEKRHESRVAAREKANAKIART